MKRPRGVAGELTMHNKDDKNPSPVWVNRAWAVEPILRKCAYTVSYKKTERMPPAPFIEHRYISRKHFFGKTFS